jgi:hypothetical protein
VVGTSEPGRLLQRAVARVDGVTLAIDATASGIWLTGNQFPPSSARTVNRPPETAPSVSPPTTCPSQMPSATNGTRPTSVQPKTPAQVDDVRRAAATLVAGEEVGDIFRAGRAYDVVVWSTPQTAPA